MALWLSKPKELIRGGVSEGKELQGIQDPLHNLELRSNHMSALSFTNAFHALPWTQASKTPVIKEETGTEVRSPVPTLVRCVD